MEKQESGIEELRGAYDGIRKKYDLPDFKILNEDFGIEKIADSETEVLIREVRKFIVDKLANYMRFIESILNPSNAPIFIFSIIKLLDAEDKKKLEEIYKEMMKSEVKFIELDLEFNEEKEADFIKDAYNFWQIVKKDLLKITGKISGRWDEKAEVNSKGYFG